MTFDLPENFRDKKLPILDTKVWLENLDRIHEADDGSRLHREISENIVKNSISIFNIKLQRSKEGIIPLNRLKDYERTERRIGMNDHLRQFNKMFSVGEQNERKLPRISKASASANVTALTAYSLRKDH